MSIKIAIMGFRHVHIFDLYKRAKESPDFDVVAACEEDPQRRKELLETGQADITFDNYQKMLDSVECDAIAVGDYFAKRAGRKAFEAPKEAIGA
jgi:predicted dehydrogenase